MDERHISLDLLHKNQPNVDKYTINGWYGIVYSIYSHSGKKTNMAPWKILIFNHLKLFCKPIW